MKIITIILIAFFYSSVSFAQSRNDLKGPAAKNFKPWNTEYSNKTANSYSDRKNLKGPSAKNYKPWKREGYDNSVFLPIASKSEKKRLSGPAAKNFKPWRF